MTASISNHQPKGLYILFFTEMWERFGYYTVQAVIILFLTQHLAYSDYRANTLVAAYSALLYITPALGGYLADKYFGFYRAVIIGGVLLLLGYLMMVVHNHRFVYLGMCVLICGNGFLKPNISSMVGSLYQKNDPRREGGFTLFYMGINLGSLFPPLITGTVVALYGWHMGFSMAAIGMSIALFVFVILGRNIESVGKMPEHSLLREGKKRLRKRFYAYLIVGLVLFVALFYQALWHAHFTELLVILATVLIVLAVSYFMLKETVKKRNRMLASLLLILLSIIFWALYSLTFSMLMLFAARNMIKHIAGFPITPEATQFFNPLYIVLLSPILNMLWFRLSKNKCNPSIPLKFALGILLMCLGFVVLFYGTLGCFADQGMVSAWWLVLSYFLQTCGELLLSPIGLSMITVLTPPNMVGMMMGVWFLASACAFAISGSLANLADVPKHTDAIHSLPIYHHAFGLLSLLSLGLVVISFALVPLLKRMITPEDYRLA